MFDKKKNAAESYGVIGLGRFGTALVKTLAAAGKEVIAVDKDEAKVKAVRGYTDYAFVIDELNETSLKETGMQNCGTVTICIGEQIDISILTTMLVTKLGVPHVISKAASEVHGEVLKRLGAEVVYPEADMAVRIGKRLISGNLLDYIALGDGVEVRRITVGGRMLGKSVRTLDLRKPTASTSSPSSMASRRTWSSPPIIPLKRGIPSRSSARSRRSISLRKKCNFRQMPGSGWPLL